MNQSKLKQSITTNQSFVRLCICFVVSLIMFSTTNAQVSKTSELYQTIKVKDSILFVIGFNNCNMDAFDKLLAEDLEFYHDKSGIDQGKSAFITEMKNGICRRGNPEKVYRILVDEQMEVFPLYDNGRLYGALQNGIHFFTPDTKTTYKNSNNYAYFSHLWLLENDKWIIKRVISYNHQSK